MKNDTIEKLTSEIIQDVKAHNKYLTNEIISKMSFNQLRANCHPNYRSDYRLRYNKLVN